MTLDKALLEQIVKEVVAEYMARSGASAQTGSEHGRDITSAENRGANLLRDTQDPAVLQRMRQRTTARIGVGRAGARLMTQTLLTLRADHAAARDAVLRDVPQSILDELGFFSVQSNCANRNEYLTRPDLGRQFTEESEKTLLERCVHHPDIQVFAADGLSSTALTANLPDLFPSLMDGLKMRGLNSGTPFFVHNGRVGVMDRVAELLDCRVTCVLLGERPGLASAESLSAYIAYNAFAGMPESNRTVVSNIHRQGVPAVEAGAYLAELLGKILAAKASGVQYAQAGEGAV